MGRRRQTALSRALVSNLYRNGDYWQWRHPDTGRRLSLGRITRQEANAIATELNNRYLNNEALNKNAADTFVLGSRVKFCDFLDEWKENWLDKAVRNGICAESTGKMHMTSLRFAKKTWGNLVLKEITLFDLTEQLKGVKNDKYIRCRAFLIQIFNWAVARGQIHSNPAVNILKASEDARVIKKKRSRLTENLFNRMIEYIDEQNKNITRTRNFIWLKDLMLMQLYTAAGENEVCNMTTDQINKDNVWVFFRKKNEKNALDPTTIQLSDAAMSIVRKAKNGRVFNHWNSTQGYYPIRPHYYAGRFREVIKKVIRPADLVDGATTNPSPHEIRALSGRLNYNNGLSLEQVSKLMSHNSLEITRHYLRGHNIYGDINAIKTGDFYGQ